MKRKTLNNLEVNHSVEKWCEYSEPAAIQTQRELVGVNRGECGVGAGTRLSVIYFAVLVRL